MTTKHSENIASTFANKVIEGAMALPEQVKKLADSVLGQHEAKPSRRSTKSSASAKPRRTTATKK